ncbi:methyl-accepting chemotaxis protein [Gilvimarinus japonicus]|uniref:Methyl-accepting chemotaxis protein n=1 Tax=Gilvimarinus japonicus TaxID=1796469 RepID=A0ABV7HW71_9GAMM
MLSLIRERSIKAKLLGVIAVAFITLLILLISQLLIQLGTMKSAITQQTRASMEQEVLGRVSSEAANLGNQVSSYINSLYRVSGGLADAMAWSITHPETRLTREQVNEQLQIALSKHQDISALYSQYEANAYDGRDQELIGSDAIHTVPSTGGLEIYWIRDQNGNIAQERVLDASEKYADEKNEFGQREAEWYLCARDTKKPCTMEPYFYEISEGYSELMTSLINPVVVAGDFKGVVGIDINLPVIQRLIEALGSELYQGKSRITLVSEQGLVVSSNSYQDALTHPLKEAMDNYDSQLQNLHNRADKTWLHNGTYYVAYPVTIAPSNTTWSLLIELPEAVVQASTNTLIATMDDNISTMLTGEIITALVATAIIMLLLLLLVRSIVQPIRSLDARMQNLASQDGDLRKNIEIDTHAELISLSDGFNRFISKLRHMIDEIKQIGTKAKGSASQIQAINNQSASATYQQQREIDSVVTATNEMSQTASGVSQLAVQVSDNATTALNTVIASREALSGSVQHVKELSDDMQQASARISDVAKRTEDIGRILDVIRAVAEQTNLLALNAAIEAARAGEQGRGFAVVADEVRNLASKTHHSTNEINELISSLKDGVDKAVEVIASGTDKAGLAMSDTQSSFNELSSVVEDVNSIADNIAQVATAAEEQSSVSEEISRNLTIIGDAATTLADMTRESNNAGVELEVVMAQLDEQLASLKT